MSPCKPEPQKASLRSYMTSAEQPPCETSWPGLSSSWERSACRTVCLRTPGLREGDQQPHGDLPSSLSVLRKSLNLQQGSVFWCQTENSFLSTFHNAH